MGTYVCRKIRLCAYLLEKGFMYEKETVDITNPKYKVWLFKDGNEIRNAIEDYYSSIPK